MVNPGRGGDDVRVASAFLREFCKGTENRRRRMLSRAPLPAIQRAAVGDPDPFARRTLLFFLDHYANDQSTAVFSACMRDPVDFVRNAALHSLSCGSCEAGPVIEGEVVPGLVYLLENDRSPDPRSKAIPILLRLARRDAGAWAAIERASVDDPDLLVRRAAADALAGRFVEPRKRYERRQRRHARGISGLCETGE